MTAASLVAGTELLARYYLGLGDPPLTVRDSEIEYMFAPSRCYRRFHNRICYNEWSMRSEGGETFDLLVLGDSVVNGGALTDQNELATEILQRKTGLRVGNVSAGSWGPANLAAYVDRFGWFRAQAAVIVLSAHDLTDVARFPEDLGPDFPESTPLLAIIEGVRRYLPRYLPLQIGSSAHDSETVDEAAGLAALDRLLNAAAAAVPSVCLVFHHDREFINTELPELSVYREAAARAGVRFVVADETPEHFRDFIHLNVSGQRNLATVILDKCLGACSSRLAGSEWHCPSRGL